MDPLKEEFARLVAIMGWNQSEAARQLHMSAAAVSNLMNANHSNRPRATTLQLLKLIVSGEHPEAMEPRKFKLREEYLDARERKLIADIRRLPAADQDTLYAVIQTLVSRSRPPDPVGYRREKKK